jgi:hypothetical protein
MPELSAQTARAALNQLLASIVGLALASYNESLSDHPGQRIDRCIERVKVDASECAALVAECAPHGRAMLTQAQQQLATITR